MTRVHWKLAGNIALLVLSACNQSHHPGDLQARRAIAASLENHTCGHIYNVLGLRMFDHRAAQGEDVYNFEASATLISTPEISALSMGDECGRLIAFGALNPLKPFQGQAGVYLDVTIEGVVSRWESGWRVDHFSIEKGQRITEEGLAVRATEESSI